MKAVLLSLLEIFDPDSRTNIDSSGLVGGFASLAVAIVIGIVAYAIYNS